MPTVRTTVEPWREIVVSEVEYLALLRLGLVYTGEPVNPPPAFTDAQYAELGSENGEAALRILRAITGSDIYLEARNAVMADVLALGYVDTSELGVALDAQTHTASEITDFATAVPAAVPAATTALQGKVELATIAEATAGADGTRAVTPAGVKAVADTKADLVGGVIPTSQLPPLAINETFVAASQTAMLALAAQRGDMAIRTDLSPARTFVLSTDSPSTLADWKEITAAGSVTSVAGKTGAVGLVKGDVGLGNVDNTADSAKPVSTAQQAALDGKAPTVHGHALTDANITGTLPVSQLPAGTTSAIGGLELATSAEALAGTDAARAIAPSTLKSVLDAIVTSKRGIVAGDNGRSYRIVSAPLRNMGSGWGVISDTGHEPMGVTSVTNDTTKITVGHSIGATKVIGACVTPDDSLAGLIEVGASVGLASTDIYLKRRAHLADAIAYVSGAWQSTAGLITVSAFSGGTITLAHANVFTASGGGGNSLVANVIGREGISGTYRYQIGGGGAGATSLEVSVRNAAGTLITTADQNMRFFVDRGTYNLAVDPSTVTNTAYPGGNLWLTVILEV